MFDGRDHTNQVNTWMAQAANGLSSKQLLQLFEQAVGALWDRAYVTLGGITLTAIMDRVLYSAGEKFPPFESLKVEPTGIDYRKLHERREVLNERELAEGIRFVIAEFIVVIGSLTAEILTPALHAQLSKVSLKGEGLGRTLGKGQS
ncbi:MAG: hypothetical protein DMG13_26380 [Acidobacteria bacterium]|nr:MAG: hypothetical protein DMG13_26380 [Acidobacteriota bacterium]